MFIILTFAFLAGIVTILSPCILPILPIILSGSLTGGKKRPLGIITGFILSFTFFTLFLSTIVRATGISADLLRHIAVAVVFAFGVSLLMPSFQLWMEQLFARLASIASANTAKTNNKSDFLGGILVGISLGLVWAPCVGPILASVISLALTGTVTASAFFITLAYSVGTAIPMFAITYGGRNLLNRVPWLTANTGTIQKTFGILMITTALAIFLNWDRQFQTYILSTFPNYGVGLTKFEDNALVQKALDTLHNKPTDTSYVGKPMNDVIDTQMNGAAEIIPGGKWFNLPAETEALSIKDLRGKVVLVDFWTYTCINCIRTLPYLKNWYAKYKDSGLVILGVHTPEFEFEKSAANVQKAIDDFGLQYPIVQDNDYATWTAYRNRYWPAKYLIDKNGNVRYTHFGEGAYDETEHAIQTLLKETGVTIVATMNNPAYRVYARTPELYLGYQRLSHFASRERITPNKDTIYTIPDVMPPSTVAYGGTWNLGSEYAQPRDGASLMLHFDASEVFLVMRPNGTNVNGGIKVYLDNEPVQPQYQGDDVENSNVKITTDRLYKLIKLPQPGEHILKIEILDPDIELYAFTFG
jgi:cytochrome c biogenesis protein CcdA/thiol-disulfide isomerase/thioredoxin